MNTESILNKKKIILDNFNKGKFEKVIKLGKKFLKKNNDFQVLYALGATNLTLKNYLEAENLISMMDSYFPPDMLEIEPGLVVLISDSIYGSTNNTVKQLEILKRLFNKKIDIQTEIYLLHKLAELNDLEFINDW